ncbi:hypothetical protein MA16_Dca018085 [Dendrobium catenatum]|uniref:Uncharacterized protein n=1 Tax=Dendrobium catenatum TaxID=906689 RepID=A0A2I0XI44_9ASPA|nr:hypothetical protein MA16_Dca018085 [Dendrobium catenatum]
MKRTKYEKYKGKMINHRKLKVINSDHMTSMIFFGPQISLRDFTGSSKLLDVGHGQGAT